MVIHSLYWYLSVISSLYRIMQREDYRSSGSTSINELSTSSEYGGMTSGIFQMSLFARSTYSVGIFRHSLNDSDYQR